MFREKEQFFILASIEFLSPLSFFLVKGNLKARKHKWVGDGTPSWNHGKGDEIGASVRGNWERE